MNPWKGGNASILPGSREAMGGRHSSRLGKRAGGPQSDGGSGMLRATWATSYFSVRPARPDRKQAHTIMRYVRGLLSVPMLAKLVVRETADAFDLDNRVTIEIGTASIRSVQRKFHGAAFGFRASWGVWRQRSAA